MSIFLKNNSNDFGDRLIEDMSLGIGIWKKLFTSGINENITNWIKLNN